MELNPWTKSELFAWNDGRRIVDLQELARQLRCKQCNSLLDLQDTEREARYGLASILYIHCNCGLLNDVHTCKTLNEEEKSRKNSPKTPVFEINVKDTLKLLMYGDGSSHVLSFLTLLDIPVPPPDDASLIVPIIYDVNTSQEPSSLPSTTAVVSTSVISLCTYPRTAESETIQLFQKSDQSLSSESLVYSVSDVLPSVNNDDGASDSVNDVTSNVCHLDIGCLDENFSDEEKEESYNGSNDNGIDYIPPAKMKLKLKPKSVSTAKRKTVSRRSEKTCAKSTAKKLTPQRKVKLKIKVKDIVTESDGKSAENEEKEKRNKEEVEEDRETKNCSKDIDNAVDWSFFESERHSVGEKEGDSFPGEEPQSKDEEKPKRKRGRPRGSMDRAKRVRKSEVQLQKEIVGSKMRGAAGEAKDVPACVVCAKDFNSIKGYNVHMKRVHNQDMKGHSRQGDFGPAVHPPAPEPVTTEIYVCKFCNQPFARDYTVLSHIKHKHWSPTLQPRECYLTMQLGSIILKMPAKKAKVHGLFTCVLCGSTMTRDPTAGHICVSPEGHLKCVNTCPEGKKLLYLEMNYLFTDKQGYLCDTCGDVFKVPVHLDTHLLKVHGIMTDRHKRCQCHICGTTFSLPSHVKKHIVQKHTLDGKAHIFICDICGKEYDRLDSMMVHKRRHHTEGKRFQCEHCPKKFFGRSHWLNHTRQHFGASNYVCRWCNQQFSSSYSLKVHQRKHTGEKPYHCKLCDACFAQKTSLTVHMKKHQKLDARVGRDAECSSTMKRSGSPEVRGANQPQDLRIDDRLDSTVTAQFQNSSLSLLETADRAGSGKMNLQDSFLAAKQEALSKHNRTERAHMDVLDPSTMKKEQPERQEKGMSRSVMQASPDPGFVGVLDASLPGQDKTVRQERPDLRAVDLVSPSLSASQSLNRSDPRMLDFGVRPPRQPQALLHMDPSQDLSLKTRRQEFHGGFAPSGHKHINLPSQEAPWSSQNYSQSELMDVRRLDTFSASRRLHVDSRPDLRLESTNSNELPAMDVSASQTVLPSFPYPGSSFYY